MKKTYILGLFLVLVLLGGCRKTLVVHVPVSPGMNKTEVVRAEKEATRQAVAEKKTEEAAARAVREIARRARQQAEWKQEFALSCPYGGYERVIIHPHLGRQYTYWRGGGAMKIIFRRVVMVHRAQNPYTNITLNIFGDGQKIVSNMCPGGSLTLVSSMEPIVGGVTKQVIWTVEGEVDGRLAHGESSPGMIWQGWNWWEPLMNRPSWVMRLNRIDQTF